MKPRIIRLFSLLGLALASTSAFAQTSSAPTTPSSAPAQPDAATPATTLDPTQAKFLDGIAVTVNDQIITVSQVRKEMDQYVPGIQERVDSEYSPAQAEEAQAEYHRQIDQLTHDVLEKLVNNLLIVEEFNKKYQPLPQDYLDKVFEDYIAVHFNGDHEAYLRALKENNMTERDLRKKLAEQEILNFMRGKLRSSVTGISPDRIKDFYEKNKPMFEQEAAIYLRQITLKPSPGAPPEVLPQLAAHLVEEARVPGADFAALARQYSQDNYAADGGKCGWTELQRLNPLLRDPLAKLEPGQVSDPIVLDPAKVPAGEAPIPVSEAGTIYIFKCDDKHAGGVQPLEDVRAQVENLLAVQDTAEAEKKWIDRLRKDAYIHYNL